MQRIPHYHGDTIRALFFAVAIIAFIGIPLWGHVLPYGTSFEVLSGIVLIVLAGIVNPNSRWTIISSVVVAAIGAFIFEVAAISNQALESSPLFLVREVEAVLLIAALYFSVRTLRAMAQGKVHPEIWPDQFTNEQDPEA